MPNGIWRTSWKYSSSKMRRTSINLLAVRHMKLEGVEADVGKQYFAEKRHLKLSPLWFLYPDQNMCFEQAKESSIYQPTQLGEQFKHHSLHDQSATRKTNSWVLVHPTVPLLCFLGAISSSTNWRYELQGLLCPHLWIWSHLLRHCISIFVERNGLSTIQ